MYQYKEDSGFRVDPATQEKSMAEINQTPEQKARDTIDQKLEAAGWTVQPNNKIDFHAGFGIAVREYQTDVG